MNLTTTPENPNTAVPRNSLLGSGVLTEREAFASLRVLVCVAMAEGELSAGKRKALANALTALEVPATVNPKSVLEERIDLDAQLRLFTTPESREALFQSALGLVQVNGLATPAEQKVLDHIRTTLHVGDEKASLARSIFEGAKDTVLPSSVLPVDDRSLRATQIKSDVLKYSVLSGVLGAVVSPGVAIAADLAVVGMQLKLVRDIGQRWGHKVDKEAAVSLLGGLGLGTGARIAVSNLASLIPFWGSVVDATSSFASTWALGQLADKYFESGMKTYMTTGSFKVAQAEGRKAYDAHKDLVESKRKRNERALQALGSCLKAGEITQQEYTGRIEQFA